MPSIYVVLYQRASTPEKTRFMFARRGFDILVLHTVCIGHTGREGDFGRNPTDRTYGWYVQAIDHLRDYLRHLQEAS